VLKIIWEQVHSQKPNQARKIGEGFNKDNLDGKGEGKGAKKESIRGLG